MQSHNEEPSVSSPDAESVDHQDPAQAERHDATEPTDGLELSASSEARKLAIAIAAAGFDKKASGIEIIDVTGKVDYAEVLVLMTGRSDRHVHAIAKGVQADIKKDRGIAPLSVEGLTAASWVLIDFNDVVVHVFQQNARLFYDLEGLWIDAGRISVPSPPERNKS